MQLKWSIAGAVALTAFWQASAYAAGTSKDKGIGGGSTAGGSEGGGGGPSGTQEAGAERGYDRTAGPGKNWQVSGAVEYHHLLQSDFAPGMAVGGPPDPGNGLNQNVVYYDVSGYWEPTPLDRIWAEWAFVQRFMKNSGEDTCPSTGPDDGIVAYRRTVPLPWGATMRVQPRVDVGLSCESIQYESLFAAPRLGVSLERDFGPVNVSLETHGYWYIVKYTSYGGPSGNGLAGGLPTPEASLHGVLRVFVTMPFYKPLSAGVLATAAATWYHQVQGTNASVQQFGTTSDPFVSDQPFQNTYGGEIFARYTFPTVNGVGSDLEVAYAAGDPSVTGYQSLLHDNGRASFDLFYRSVSEVFTALTVRY
jgi:hypothetical protein